eukprot:478151-Prymnesium_polylepis.1
MIDTDVRLLAGIHNGRQTLGRLPVIVLSVMANLTFNGDEYGELDLGVTICPGSALTRFRTD